VTPIQQTAFEAADREWHGAMAYLEQTEAYGRAMFLAGVACGEKASKPKPDPADAIVERDARITELERKVKYLQVSKP
jgi:hypothetical protein